MKNGNRQKVKKMRKLIIAYLTTLFLISCATVSDNYKNPVEEAAVNKDQYAKVTFYNDTNLMALINFKWVELRHAD